MQRQPKPRHWRLPSVNINALIITADIKKDVQFLEGVPLLGYYTRHKLYGDFYTQKNKTFLTVFEDTVMCMNPGTNLKTGKLDSLAIDITHNIQLPKLKNAIGTGVHFTDVNKVSLGHIEQVKSEYNPSHPSVLNVSYKFTKSPHYFKDTDVYVDMEWLRYEFSDYIEVIQLILKKTNRL